MRAIVWILCVTFVVCGAAAQNPPVTIALDVQANRHPINSLIYGVNLFDDSNLTTILQDLNAPVNRYGGNRASTYNWNTNSDNRGNDYYFESISDASSTVGERVDTFVTVTRNAGTEPMITVPMLDWVAKAGTAQPFPCSYPQASFPNQASFDPFDPNNCGNGLMPDGVTKINGADPNSAYVPNSLANQQSWVQHVINTFGAAGNGGVRYYILDNEHDLWWGTHHDVVPQNPSYTLDRDNMISYAAMVKAQDANAIVVGPEMSGWLGYILSPADYQYGETNGYNFANFPDRNAMGGSDYAPWLLGQFQAYETNNGKRLLDFFTVHYYPQGGDKFVNTRSLWDPNYVDPSYINETIQLIPRLKQWVAGNYPGTKIGITEYNWCNINNEAATDNIGCAIAQADVLGIFGREGLDLATRFNAPVPNLPSYNAMKMFRNYDGNKSTFGDVSVSTTDSANPDSVAAFAAQRTSDSVVTAMLLSKYLTGTTAVTLTLANSATSGTSQVWQLSGNGSAIQRLADITLANGSVAVTVPAQSITLLVITGSQAAPAVSFSAQTVNFGAQLIHTSTPASSVTLTNTGTAVLTISNVAVSGNLSQMNNCGASLAAGANCVIAIAPAVIGETDGTLTITDNAPGAPHTIAIFGRGDLPLSLTRPLRLVRSTTQAVITAQVRTRTVPSDTAAAANAILFTPLVIEPLPPPRPCSNRNPSPSETCDDTKTSKHNNE